MDTKEPKIVQEYKNGNFFAKTTLQDKGNKQITKVVVKIEQKDDCLTGCFKAITECFKRK